MTTDGTPSVSTGQPSLQSLMRVRRFYIGLNALYVPSVIEDAARLLDDLLDTATKHGHNRDAEGLAWLTSAAAEATSGRHRRPAVERAAVEHIALLQALTDELGEQGLTMAAAQPRSAVAVAPVEDGPTWGGAGLAVAIYSDAGWDLMVNRPQSRCVGIYAPATADGAKEVAALVHDIMHGQTANPFQQR